MNKRVIIVFRKLSSKEKSILARLKQALLLSLQPEGVMDLQEAGLRPVTLKDFFDKEEYDRTYDEIIAFFERLGQSKTQGSETLANFLTYSGIPFWSLWVPHLSGELFPDFLAGKILERVFLKEKPKEIILIAKGHSLEKRIISLSRAKGIGLRVYYPNFFLRAEIALQGLVNYLVITKEPLVSLLKKMPFLFIWVEKGKNFIFRKPKFSSGVAPVTKDKKSVFFLSFYTYHSFLREISGLLAELQTRDKLAVTVARIDILPKDFVRKCKKKKIRYKTFKDYIDKGSEREQKRLAGNFFNKIRRLDWKTIFEQNQRQEGGLTTQDIEKFTRIFFCKFSFFRTIRLKLATERLLDLEKPDFIIIPEDKSAYGQIVASVLIRKGVPFLVNTPLPSLFDYDIFFNVFARKNNPLTKVTVANQKIKNLLVHYGAIEKNVTVIGSTLAERLASAPAEKIKKSDVYRKLKIPEEKKIILFPSQNLPHSQEVHRKLIAMMQYFPEAHLVLKKHSTEKQLRDKLVLKKAKLKNISLVKDFDIGSLIKASELLITISSLTAAEAMILKTPVIILELSPYSATMDYLETNTSSYVESGAALGVNRPEELIPAVKKVLTDQEIRKEMLKKAEKFIDNYLGSNGQRFSCRLANIVEEELKIK